VIHLDTHVVAWLFAGELELLPEEVKQILSSEELAVSPMVLLELDYLKEIGRITSTGKDIADDLAIRLGLAISTTPLSAIVPCASTLSWTRDPFDRIIVGHAMAEGVRLVTADHTILANFENASWGG